jgi:hopanoid biosynthesis associated protein HpnK
VRQPFVAIVADDFGLSAEVNDAVDRGHRDGVLSAASLMVAEPFAADAVALARRLKSLRVGLHLSLVEGRPLLPPERVPDLIDPQTGRLRTDMPRLGLDLALHPKVRRQMAAEIAAQFAAFAATGLKLDHVNAHKHFHVHPIVAHLVLGIGRRFGMRALRVPWERPHDLAAIEAEAPGRDWSVAPWAALLRLRARMAGLTVPDAVIGLAWSGAMTPPRLADALRQARGFVEIYCHPATAGGFDGAAQGYRYADELAALLAPGAREALAQSGARRGGYADLLA